MTYPLRRRECKYGPNCSRPIKIPGFLKKLVWKTFRNPRYLSLLSKSILLNLIKICNQSFLFEQKLPYIILIFILKTLFLVKYYSLPTWSHLFLFSFFAITFAGNWHIILNFIPCELLFPACIITYQPHFTRNWHIILDISFSTLFLVNYYFLPALSHVFSFLSTTLCQKLDISFFNFIPCELLFPEIDIIFFSSLWGYTCILIEKDFTVTE